MNGSWDAYLASPTDFAGADDIVTNLAKERKPSLVTSNTLPNLIITSIVSQWYTVQHLSISKCCQLKMAVYRSYWGKFGNWPKLFLIRFFMAQFKAGLN